MPLYTFECDCGNRFDEFIRFENYRRESACEACGGMARKILTLPNTNKDLAYNFIDTNTTGRPIQITSKGQWKKHLKKLGLTDDFSQAVPKHSELKQIRKQESKESRIEGHKKVIETVLRDSGKIR